ncbi:glutamyl-tRNA synthetase [Phlegmacium glaucopus]|nr:glutamyl-tRNA synthetase [Phlegmacium glaucopus]
MALLRFAPSPTGPLHLGGLRMALYNHLFTRKNGGKWILRIEDTDMTRNVPGSVDGIRKALEWAGLNYDFGPGSSKDGPHGPYYQSERLDLYKQYAGKLLETGHAYRCFCSPDVLTETRVKLARSGSSTSYDRRCLHLTEEEVARKVKAGEKHVVRFNNTTVPSRPPATDLIFGQPKDAHASLATDPILLKTDMFPTYHLASVVDDHEMGITHVFRGEEWLPSLPLHLDIFASLNLPTPAYAHFPILLNADGSKMSKRHGDVQVADFVKRGWEPAALLNWLVLSGWGVGHSSPVPGSASQLRSSNGVPDSTKIMTLDEMIDQFDITALTHRNTILEASKLEYINKHHLMHSASTPMGIQALAQKAYEQTKEAFPRSQYATTDTIKHAIVILEGRLTNIYDIPKHAPYLFEDPILSSEEAQTMLSQIRREDYDQIIKTVKSRLEDISEPWEDVDFSKILHAECESLGLSIRVFMKALRYALTGMKDGPSMAAIMKVIGRERTLERLK